MTAAGMVSLVLVEFVNSGRLSGTRVSVPVGRMGSEVASVVMVVGSIAAGSMAWVWWAATSDIVRVADDDGSRKGKRTRQAWYGLSRYDDSCVQAEVMRQVRKEGDLQDRSKCKVGKDGTVLREGSMLSDRRWIFSKTVS